MMPIAVEEIFVSSYHGMIGVTIKIVVDTMICTILFISERKIVAPELKIISKMIVLTNK